MMTKSILFIALPFLTIFRPPLYHLVWEYSSKNNYYPMYMPEWCENETSTPLFPVKNPFQPEYDYEDDCCDKNDI